MTENHRPQHIWKATSSEHFHRWAEHYDRDIINILLFRPSFRRVLEWLRRWQRQGLKNLRLLDVGCGTGNLLLWSLPLRPLLGTIVGLDMSGNMLSRAHSKFSSLSNCRHVHLTGGDAENLCFRNNSFDIVTCCNSFHHYPDQQQAVNEMHRVLRPDGRLILIDGSRDDLFGYFIFEICVAHVEGHVYHCTRRRFQKLLIQAGFSDIYQNVFGLCPPALINVARAIK